MKPKIWAHRGASAYAPENTLDAFRIAAKMGADGVELDVYLTADGQLAVHHDELATRMTNGACAMSIKETDFAELSKYKYSGAFSDRFPNAKIPLLGEVYDSLKPTGLYINVELKAGGDGFVETVLKCTAAHGMEKSVIYSSFDHNLLRRIRVLHSRAKIAPLYSKNITESPWNYVGILGGAATHPHYQLVFADGYIQNFHDYNIDVNVWTVDAPETIKMLAEIGVDAIITNVPDVALNAIGR